MAKKSELLKDFEASYTEWYWRTKHPMTPEHCRHKQTFNDDTAPHLEKAIQAYGDMHGWCLSKISTTGVFRDNRKVVTDCLGNRRMIGSAKWTPGGATKGVADITGVINGRYVEIEVKIGRDRQSDVQKEHQAKVEAAGGIYIIAKTFDGFVEALVQHQLITPYTPQEVICNVLR